MNDTNCEPAQGETGKPMTKEMVANFMSIAPRTVEHWVLQGILPKPTQMGRRAYWHPDVIKAWLNSWLPTPDMPTPTASGPDLSPPTVKTSTNAKRRGRPRSALPVGLTAKQSKPRRRK